MASGATRLRPVARSGDAGGSGWPLQAVGVDAGPALADRDKNEGRAHRSGRRVGAEAGQGDGTDARAAGGALVGSLLLVIRNRRVQRIGAGMVVSRPIAVAMPDLMGVRRGVVMGRSLMPMPTGGGSGALG